MKNKEYPLLITVLLLILVGFVSFTYGDCSFPKRVLPNGKFLYQKKEDYNLTVAPEDYLLKFKCRNGFTLKGSQRILCRDNQWTNTVPKCLKMSCDDPPMIKNGTYKLNAGTSDTPVLGSTVEYMCDDGYELRNSTISTLSCTLSEDENSVIWKGKIPSCKQKISCLDPGVSADGERIGKTFFVGDNVQFTCNEGFELIGNESISCLLGGHWNSRRPLCRPVDTHCNIPPEILHGVAKGEKEGDYYRPFDEVEIMCEPGYAYKGVTQFMLCEETGEWEDEFGECTEVFCDPPPELGNGTIPELKNLNVTSFPYNFEITYICNEGFRLIGDSWRFCDNRGWSGKTPHCEIIHCPDPGVPEHGTSLVNSFEVGDKVLFKCFTGYNLIGSFERYCMPNGQWSGELARCDHGNNYCPDPGSPINGLKNSSTYDMGEIVRFQCFAGYSLLGSEIRECLPNKTWSGIEAKCIGPYDFDNSAKVRDILLAAISEKEEEQKKKIQEYRQVWNSRSRAPIGRILDLNFPGRIILYFAFDVSGSVGEHNFRKSIEFAKAIVKRIGISDIGARAGALTFSSKAEEQFLPLRYKTTEEVLDALDSINYTGGGTSASSALALIREELIPLTQAVLKKRGQKSVIFILTDGKANMGGDPQQEAELLKKAGVEIYCIGITSTVLQDSLYKIASENDAGSKEEHVFILQNYATMEWLVQKITNGTIDYSQCGLGLEKLGKKVGRGKVIGGRQAPEPWPWMAALYFKDSKHPEDLGSELQCGGSIIHEKFILTAAHCLYTYKGKPRKKDEIRVKLGLTDVENVTSLEEFEVENIFRHESYRFGKFYDYDIALLYLKRPIEYNELIRPICLPPIELPANSSLYKPGQYSVAAGWGHTTPVKKMGDIDFTSVKHLKQIPLPIQPNNRCLESAKQNLPDLPIDKVFTDRMFCAGDGNGGNDTCRGDSGGPLMQSQLNSEGNTYWTQVGIVSWGIGCAQPNTYGYYTHVQKLYIWIANIIDSLKTQ